MQEEPAAISNRKLEKRSIYKHKFAHEDGQFDRNKEMNSGHDPQLHIDCEGRLKFRLVKLRKTADV
jgi:hypothetical protein